MIIIDFLSFRMITKRLNTIFLSYILFRHTSTPVSFASLIMVHTFIRKRVTGFRGKRDQLNCLLKNLKESQAEARALTSSRGLWRPLTLPLRSLGKAYLLRSLWLVCRIGPFLPPGLLYSRLPCFSPPSN